MTDNEIEKASEGATGTFTHCFKNAIEYNGEKIEELSFDFDSLSGKDALAIDKELKAKGIIVPVPALDTDYLLIMAAKACTQNIGTDIFECMSLFDFNKIKSAARAFLLRSE